MAYPDPPKILYVEDDEIVRLVTSEALRDAGFRILTAASGDEAILLLAEPDDVDLVVTDVRLPGTLDGIDLALETRKAYPAMPVLVASGYSVQLSKRLRDLNPPALFMTKPYALDKMVEAVRTLTRGR